MAKNVLVFVPLVLSGMASQPAAVINAMIAFGCISLMASGTYLINDLFDLDDDRDHRSKRYRPLASGSLRIKDGVRLAGELLLSGALRWEPDLGPPTLGMIAI